MSTKANRPKAIKAAAKPARHTTVRVDDVAEMRKMVDYFKANRAEGRALLVKAGIYTENGKLTKAFGG